jgi:hypothetical protein
MPVHPASLMILGAGRTDLATAALIHDRHRAEPAHRREAANRAHLSANL